MARQAVFFDRDNTLIVNDGYLGDPAGVRLVAGAADAIARVRKLGYAVVVISNQSGVARGMFTEEDVRAVDRRMDELLRAENAHAVVDAHEFCPFHPDGTVAEYARESDLRKPRPGMILAARRKLGLAPGGWCIGDAPRDIEAGAAAGCRTILVAIPGLTLSPAARGTGAMGQEKMGDFNATSLAEAVHIVERESRVGDP